MKINLMILLGLVILTGIWTLWSNRENRNVTQNTTLGAAPIFNYTTINGHQGSLSDYEGKVVLVHFWASWCAPCIVEFPSLVDLAHTTKEDLIVLAISTDNKKSDITKFLKKINRDLPSNFHIIQDSDKSITEGMYKTIKLPETFAITPSQQIFEKITGPEENWNSQLWYNKIRRYGGA